MDAKPQRPGRSFRVRDENLPPTNYATAGKTLHQRNKSTPALLSQALGGINKPTTKRTAFADVSNTVRTGPVAKDDMILASKGTLDALSKASNALSKPSAVESLKSAALLRPAQRPSSALISKGALANATISAASVLTKDVVAEPNTEFANVKKVLSKRATIIFKETASSTTVPTSSTANEARAAVSVAPVQQILPSQRENAPQQFYDAPAEQPIREPVIKESAIQAQRENDYLIQSIRDSIATSHASDNVPTHSKYTEVRESRPGCQNIEASIIEDLEKQEYLLGLERQAKLIESAAGAKLAQQTRIPPISEVEEYWDEDDEEEYYEADGYTTCRSLRSRGDNTTGGMTTVLVPRITARVERELAAAKVFVDTTKTVEDVEDEAWDTSMVAEYGDEIFDYMRTLEERMRPNAHYMDNQAEIQWSMRSVLMDWLVQVHHRFTLLPETLFLAVNYVDRFLSCKVVSLGKLQLVGATAIFVAAKYEEINCPSVQEIVYMVDGGYTVDEILKAERFMLSMLQFELGWPGPMSFLRRISKADDYDLETRTLAKYFLEVTVMDERFVGCTPSFTSAGAHCLARLMLRKGDWSQAHVHYSQYTYSQLRHLVSTIIECCENPQKHHQAVFDKYADKRYKRASMFVEGELQKGFELPPVARDNTTGYTTSWRRK